MFEKFSVRVIVAEQLASMQDAASGRPDIRERIILFVLPLAPALLLGVSGFAYSDTAAGIVISAASIFAALLLNLLLLVYGMLPKDEAEKRVAASSSTHLLEKMTIRYTFFNIAFSILISLLLVLVSLFAFSSNLYINAISLACTAYLGSQLFLSILQVLKRCFILLENRLR